MRSCPILVDLEGDAIFGINVQLVGCSSEIAMLRILHFLPIEFLKQSSYSSHNLHERERCDGSTLPRSTDEGRL